MEAQVLRDGLPLTRPTRWAAGLKSFEPGELAAFKLFPGSINMGDDITLAIVHTGWVAPRWIGVMASLAINGNTWPASLPGQIYVGEDPAWGYGGWTCVINYPIMSHYDTFKGVHTLLLRTIVEPVRSR